MNLISKSFLLLAALALAAASPDFTRQARNLVQTEDNLLDSIYSDCLEKDTLTCIKHKVLSYADKVNSASEIAITDGIEITKTAEPSDSARSLSDDASLIDVIINKVQSFLDSHTLKIELNGKDLARQFSDFTEEERGKKGGLIARIIGKKLMKILGPFISIFGIKALFVGKIVIFALALIAKKALIMSKIALLIAGFLAFKKFFGNKGGAISPSFSESHQYSYETLHPVSADHGHSYGGSAAGGWGRTGQEMAYSAYVPANQ